MIIRKACRFRWKLDKVQQRWLDRGVPLLRYGDPAKCLTLWRASEEHSLMRLSPSIFGSL